MIFLRRSLSASAMIAYVVEIRTKTSNRGGGQGAECDVSGLQQQPMMHVSAACRPISAHCHQAPGRRIRNLPRDLERGYQCRDHCKPLQNGFRVCTKHPPADGNRWHLRAAQQRFANLSARWHPRRICRILLASSSRCCMSSQPAVAEPCYLKGHEQEPQPWVRAEAAAGPGTVQRASLHPLQPVALPQT